VAVSGGISRTEGQCPTGADKNWIRLLAVVEGFFVTHGHWPSRVRLPFLSYTNLRYDLFTPASWERLTARIWLVPNESGMIAEDEAGNAYDYGKLPFTHSRPAVHADEWLGVRPDTPVGLNPD
jgi:hypothetical protein